LSLIGGLTPPRSPVQTEKSRGYRSPQASDAGPEPELAAGRRRQRRPVAGEGLERIGPDRRSGGPPRADCPERFPCRRRPHFRDRPSAKPTVRDGQQYAWEDWANLQPAEDEPVIRTRQLRLRVPEVITLTKYDRLPANAVTFSRRNVFKRDRFTCQYCGRQPGADELTIDHVIPRSMGGTSTCGRTACWPACLSVVSCQ
jgi:5-methylcytosine-specific restriction endonuclease McrA